MTSKQRAVLVRVWNRGTPSGTLMDDLVSELGAGSTKQAMQSTIRTLERRKLLLRSYRFSEGRNRLVLELTPEGVTLASGL